MAGPARPPGAMARTFIEVSDVRLTRVVLAAAHLDNNPTNNRLANLRSLCQRWHMLHDRPFHLAQRWLTYRRRWAIGDLFFGQYGIQPPLVLFAATFHPRPPPSCPNLRLVGRRMYITGSADDLFKQLSEALPRRREQPGSLVF